MGGVPTNSGSKGSCHGKGGAGRAEMLKFGVLGIFLGALLAAQWLKFWVQTKIITINKINKLIN